MRSRERRGPQFLHIVTRKGKGYRRAEVDPIAYHGPGKFDPAEGLKKPTAPGKPTFTTDTAAAQAAVVTRLRELFRV